MPLTLSDHGLGEFVSYYLACIEYGGLRIELDGFCDATAFEADLKGEGCHFWLVVFAKPLQEKKIH